MEALERMGAFFNARVEEYDGHQLDCIVSAREFYAFTAACLPNREGARVLDLGCGTGLELEPYFKLVPTACVTGIDLAPGMLGALLDKFPSSSLRVICDSYFDVAFGDRCYDAVVSVESLHHFRAEEKLPLYRKIRDTLDAGGFFLLTDYFAADDAEEQTHFEELAAMKAEQGITDGRSYHYDTPLTLRHEISILREAGFAKVRVLESWGKTSCLRAYR